MRDLHHLDAGAHGDAIACQLVEHDACRFRIVLGEGPRRFQHGDGAAEAAEGLRHFETDRAGANDYEMLRPFGQREDRLVGQIRSTVETGDRRYRRRGAGGNNKTPGADPDVIADRDRLPVSELCLTPDHLHAEAGESLLGVDGCDFRDDVVHVGVHFDKIHMNL